MQASPCFVLVAALAAPLACQETLPDAAELLDAAQKKDAASATVELRSLRMAGKASFELQIGKTRGKPVAGTFEELYQGDKAYEGCKLAKLSSFEQGTDGETVWEIDSAEGPRIVTGADRALHVRIWGMQMGDSWRDHYTAAKTLRAEQVEGRACWALELLPKEGKAEVWYLDHDGLVAGVDVEMAVGTSRENTRIRLSDYTRVDGLPYPKRMTIEFSAVKLAYDYETIEHNVAIPAERFALPAAIVALRGQAAAPVAEGDAAVAVISVPERSTLTIRVKTTPQEIGKVLAEILPEVCGYMNDQGLVPPGPPFTRYFELGAAIDLEAGVPVGEKVEGKGRIQASSLPGGKVVTAWHIGPYRELRRTYQRLARWLREHELEEAGPPWEVYWTDPGSEPDETKYRTQVFWPVK